MADRYVSPSGSDSNPTGTISAPWQTIAYAVTRTLAGDTLWVRGGTYTGSSASIDAQGHTVNSGSSWSNAVTISGYPGESAILQPSGVGGVRMSDGGASPARSYIIIQDLTMDCVNSTGEGIFLFTAHHIRMQRLDVKNCPGVGAGGFGVHFGDDTPFNEMLNCRIHDIGSIASLVTEGHGLYITASDNLFQGCEVYNCAGYGFHVYNNRGDHGDPNRNVIRNNRIHHNGRITGNTAYGITVTWGDANQVYNNLIYENFAGVQLYTDSTNTLLANNTIYANVNEGISLQFHGSGIIVRNNIIFGNGSTISNIAGTATLDHNVTTDPLVVNAAAFDYHLTGASAAVLNLGATIGGLAGDYDGGARPFGASYDVGAYEYGSTAGAVTEPGIDDTGAGGGSSGSGTVTTVPVGSLAFISDATVRFISPAGVDLVDRAVPSGSDRDITHGNALQLAAGPILLAYGNNGLPGAQTVEFLTSQWAPVATISSSTTSVSAASTSQFFFEDGTGLVAGVGGIDKYTGAGVSAGSVSITAAIGAQILQLGVSMDGATIYTGESDSGPITAIITKTSAGSSSTFVDRTGASPGTGDEANVGPGTLLVLQDGTVVSAWTEGPTGTRNAFLLLHDPSGTELLNIDLGGTGAAAKLVIAMARGASAAYFWAAIADVPTSTTTIAKIRTSDGVVLSSFDRAWSGGSISFVSLAFFEVLVAITTSSTTTPTPTIPSSVPCCGHDGGSSAGPILPPTGPGWTPLCVGAGAVDTAADLVDSESWVGV